MATYWNIAEMDERAGDLLASENMHREAVFYYQQAGEKYAKYILEQVDPRNPKLKSHVVEKILTAYDNSLKASLVFDQANYLTSFYFDTRYPGDNYDEIIDIQVKKARENLTGIKKYCEDELKKLETSPKENLISE